MGKRIKLIYILSLFSALMAISVQAYWLYNQYRYEVERYADEIAADVLRVGDEEFAERRKMVIGDDISYIIDRSSRTQSGTSTIQTFNLERNIVINDISFHAMNNAVPVRSYQTRGLVLSYSVDRQLSNRPKHPF